MEKINFKEQTDNKRDLTNISVELQKIAKLCKKQELFGLEQQLMDNSKTVKKLANNISKWLKTATCKF